MLATSALQTHDPADAVPTAVVVPIRAFDGALSRLSDVLSPVQRSNLMRAMARRVLAAAAPHAVHVATDDREVSQWAHGEGAEVITVGSTGLNAAAQVALERLGSAGFGRVVVAHGDLACVQSLHPVIGPGVVIAPDRGSEGSNVVCVPADSGFEFSYGPGSFGRHCAEAHRLGLALRVVRDPTLAADIDDPSDLRRLLPPERAALGLDNPRNPASATSRAKM